MSLKSDDLMPCGLYGSRFMYGYVSGRRSYDSFTWPQQKLDDCCVGLGASGEEEHFSVWAGYCGTNEALCAVSMRIYAVARSLLVVSE